MNFKPDANNLSSLTRPTRPGLRTAAYCVVLAVLSAVLMFSELGVDALTGDEAQYALVVQTIQRTGTWLYVTPYPPTPYLQKPPLYFWLTAATHDLFGPTELTYRLWSAAAGVGAVVLTCVLGALLFGPEIGAVAGLLLMTNRAFLLVHGARSGTFDALVTFLVVAAVVIYVLVLRGRFRWAGWVGIGVVAGLASLTKPFVGVPIVGLLAIHTLFADRSTAVRVRLAGPILAMLCLAAVAVPWYAAQWMKYPEFFHEMLQRNLVERATEGVDGKHVEDWNYYAEQISKSSIPFLLSIPAMLYAAYAALKGPRRVKFALLALFGWGWVLLFSASASKAVHYIYPAFPVVAVALTAGVARAAHAAARTWTGTVRVRSAALAAAVLLAGFTFQYTRLLYGSIPADRSPYVPWEMYKALAPAMARGEAQVIFYGFPDAQVDWRSRLGLRARDCYYLEQMRIGARWAREWGELANELHPQKPSLVILARSTNAEEMLPKTNLAQRTDARFTYSHARYLLVGVDLQPLLTARATPTELNPGLRVSSVDRSTGAARFELSPAVAGPARLSVRLRTTPGDARGVRYAFALDKGGSDLKTLESGTTFSSHDGMVELSTYVEGEFLAAASPVVISLAIYRSSAATGDPLFAGTVEEARLTMLPSFPPEPHPRR